MKLSEELKWRGFVNQTTFKDITDIDKQKIVFYWGVDPSAPSMTIGNLAAAMMAKHFINAGHEAVLLVGGATGLIGDPDGKAEEREIRTVEDVENSKKGIVSQYKTIFEGQDFKVVDNYDWFKDLGYLDFLREVGKNVPMRQMLGRDFVQTRLGEGGAGISYAEFSYVLIQAYDFYYLNKNHGVNLQLCGSDQWGNSIAGVDLIRRISGQEAHVWSSPLVINKATGKKFGKTEGGAVWLSAEMTSPYQFYQFWLNTDDEGAKDYIKIYTMLSKEVIEGLIADSIKNPGERKLQKNLAYEVTKLIHGEVKTEAVRKVTSVLFGEKEYTSLSQEDFAILTNELPCVDAKVGEQLIDAVVLLGLASSKGEARRFVAAGSIYVNGLQRKEETSVIAESDAISGHVVLRRGKNQFGVVKLS